VDVYAESFVVAVAGCRAIEAVLSGRREGRFQGIFLDAVRDLPAADAGEVSHLFRRMLDFTLWFQET
jgi:hypothetical protein